MAEPVSKAIEDGNFKNAATDLSGVAKSDGALSLLEKRQTAKVLLLGAGIKKVTSDWSRNPPLQSEVEEYIKEVQ